MELICIVCPNGCKLTVNNDGTDVTVDGAKCPRGRKYAVSELTAPTRSLTSTVRTVFADKPVLSVRTDGEIPKDKIFAVMKAINSVTVTEKLSRGDVVIKNVLSLNVDVIATDNVD